ncbi:MAG: hypothetical protein ACM37W_27645 [Actinomycetota bacterium]
MEKIQAEIQAIRSHLEALRRERQQISLKVVLPTDDSPQAIADSVRRQARENITASAEVQGIDEAIAVLEAQLQQKQREWEGWQKRNPIERQVEEGRQQAHLHAERINQLAAELATEVKALKAIADEISPSYWQVYYKPFITGFKSISVPYVRSDGDVWTIVNRVV